LAARLVELKKYQNKTILVNCQRGMRSAKACDILRHAEFTQVHNLQGGLTAWIEAKLPVVTQTLASKGVSKSVVNKSEVVKAKVSKKASKVVVIEAEIVEVAPKKPTDNEVV
jgi:3-mercaptopyruvate sulfurtransferase SseA